MTSKLIISLIGLIGFIPVRAQSIPKFSESISSGDTLTIQRISLGCFHEENEVIQIYLENDSIVAEEFDLNRRQEDTTIIYLADWPKENSKVLPVSLLSELDSFQKELMLRHNNSCTTEDTYLISCGSNDFKILDGSCEWYGFGKLKMTIFGK